MAKKEQAWNGSVLTWILILINVIAFLVVFSAPESIRENLFDGLSLSRGTALEAWRWLTSMFMHAGASHLFFNMLGLFFFGRILEREVGGRWFLSIYFVSGLVGSLAFILTSAAPAVGASGAIFGLIGAAMLLKPLEKVNFFVFPLPMALVAALFIITESFISYYQPEFGNVAHIAHLGGLATGALFAFFNSPKKAGKGLLWLILLGVLLIIIAPIIGLVADAGSFLWGIVDFVVGVVLYGLASLLGFLWG